MTKTKPKIFVSHSSNDNQFASRLVDDLKAYGANAWMDVNDLGAGSFLQHINEDLAKCAWFLLVLTRNALASRWVRKEVEAAMILEAQEQIKGLIFIQAGEIADSELPPLWRVYQRFPAMQYYNGALQHILKAMGISSTPDVSASGPTSHPPIGTRNEVIARPVLRVINGESMSAAEAEQVELAEAALAESQLLAKQLADRLQSLSIHAFNADSLGENFDMPDSLEMVGDLANRVRDYVTDPYAALCECHAPLMDQKCRSCGERMCTGDGMYQSAPVTFGEDCGRTPVAWQVKDERDEFVEVCSRHTYEEVS